MSRITLFPARCSGIRELCRRSSADPWSLIEVGDTGSEGRRRSTVCRDAPGMFGKARPGFAPIRGLPTPFPVNSWGERGGKAPVWHLTRSLHHSAGRGIDVYAIGEIAGSSTESIEEAIANALGRAEDPAEPRSVRGDRVETTPRGRWQRRPPPGLAEARLQDGGPGRAASGLTSRDRWTTERPPRSPKR
jgi:hypothetical protein